MSRIAVAALAVWAATIAVAVYLFFNGYTTPGRDGREVVLVTPAERDQTLEEMRGLLQATADILAALARNDKAAVSELARPVGMAAMEEESPALLAKLPLPFKQAGLQAHQAFDALGSAAAADATTQQLTGMLAEQLMICTGCHASYRLGE